MIRIPRQARKYLAASFFHIIIQGQEKEYIFPEKRYIYEYINLLKKYRKETNIKVIAYCMMNNHGHFLLKVSDMQELSKMMQKVNSVYARYYNYMKGNRVGYVYRDRFLSEPITSHQYLVECIKYIHFNPVKAKMVNNCSQYKFSSYNFFCKSLNQKKFHEFLTKEDYEDICYNINYSIEFLDINKDIKEIMIEGIQRFLEERKYKLFQIFEDREILRELIFYLKEKRKVTYVEIRNFFGITRGVMQRLIIKKKV